MPTRLIFGRMIDSTPTLITRHTVSPHRYVQLFFSYLRSRLDSPSNVALMNAARPVRREFVRLKFALDLDGIGERKLFKFNDKKTHQLP